MGTNADRGRLGGRVKSANRSDLKTSALFRTRNMAKRKGRKQALSLDEARDSRV